MSDEEIEQCTKCGHRIEDDDYKYDYQTSECHGAPATERIVTGYQCPKCGHEEVY